MLLSIASLAYSQPVSRSLVRRRIEFMVQRALGKSELRQAKRFILSDIRREIRLAYASKNDESREHLKRLGIPAGGGNFLAALGLLCYTEFAGKLKYGKRGARQNFDSFFDDLGPDYKAFRQSGVNVYNVFRCGLAHEYYVKHSCDIHMTKKKRFLIGIGKDQRGRYWFVIETYIRDFRKALNAFLR